VGFLKDEKRLNVMLTRAKKGLIVVGDQSTLCNDENWQRWFRFIEEQKVGVIISSYFVKAEMGAKS
jgi:superfamily I DNA and/or RNA helicase